MNHGRRPVIHPVTDLARAKALSSTLLLVEPYVDTADCAGFRTGDQEIGLDPNGHASGMTGLVGYGQVDDIERSLQALLDAGAKTPQAIRDAGRRDADRLGEGRRRKYPWVAPVAVRALTVRAGGCTELEPENPNPSPSISIRHEEATPA